MNASQWLSLRQLAAVSFAGVMLLAAVLRVGTAILLPNVAHVDEIFQVQEQAHRVVYGSGIVPWEFVVGLRSWIFPGFLIAIAEISRILSTDPATFPTSAKLCMVLLSLIPVGCGWRWGYRMFDLPGAIITATVLATWVDLIYYSSHTLSEVAAANFLVLGLCILEPGDRADVTVRQLILAGLSLGLAAILRIQLAPAVAIAAIWICRSDIKRCWLPFAASAGSIVLIAGLIDLFTWGSAFRSIWLNIWLNVFVGVSQIYGVEPWYRYGGVLFFMWGGAVAVIAVAALIGARRLPMVFVVAAAVLVTHSALSHKEPRFIFPAIPLVMALCAIGTCEICRALKPNTKFTIVALTLTAVGFWVLTSAALAVSPFYQSMWEHNRGMLLVFRAISADRHACGVAFVALDNEAYDDKAGQTNLPTGVPIYVIPDYEVKPKASAFNFMITSGRQPSDADFTLLGCFNNGRFLSSLQPRPQSCLWHRTGACAPDISILPPTNWPKDGLTQWKLTGK